MSQLANAVVGKPPTSRECDLARLCAAAGPEPRAATAPPAPGPPAPGPPAWSLRRWLLPSFSDLFFIALILWTFSSGDGWQALLLDGDAGWHIRTGEYILDHRSVPHQDLFSFSRPGAPWFAWEWLADLADAVLFRALGLKGVVLLAGLIAALFAWVVLRHLIWRGANAFIALAVTLVAVNASSIHFHARPHVWTLLFLAATMWLLDADRRAPSRRVALLVPLTLLWCNLHGGFLAGIAAIGLTAGGAALEAISAGAWSAGAGKIWRQARWRPALRYAALAGACALASLANPYGIELHRHILDYLRSDWIHNTIQEFQSPVFRGEAMANFEFLLVVGLLAAGLAARRGQFVGLLYILFFAHQALASARHVPLYAIVAAPLVAGQVSDWWRALVRGRPPGSVLAILEDMAGSARAHFAWSSLWLGIFVLLLVALDRPFRWPVDFPPEVFPAAVVRKHAAELARGRVFTYDQWADYLIFVSYPRQRVFFDGRSDFYGAELGRDYVAMVQGNSGWDRKLDTYGFNVVLAPVNWPLAELLKQRRDWRIVEDTGKAILFVARDRTSVLPAGVSAGGSSAELVPKNYRDDKKPVASLMKRTDSAEIETGGHE